MGQTAISCTDRKRPGSLPELRLTQSAHHFMYISLRHGHHRQDTTLHNTPYNTLRLLLPTAYSNTEDYKWLKLQIIRYSFFT
jgi:hypothetical protein